MKYTDFIKEGQSPKELGQGQSAQVQTAQVQTQGQSTQSDNCEDITHNLLVIARNTLFAISEISKDLKMMEELLPKALPQHSLNLEVGKIYSYLTNNKKLVDVKIISLDDHINAETKKSQPLEDGKVSVEFSNGTQTAVDKSRIKEKQA